MIRLIVCLFLLANQVYAKITESLINEHYAKLVHGRQEVKLYYKNGKRYVIADIETDTEVIECGLDKRSSLDSLQQALFFSYITHKKPVVVIYDTNGQEGAIEFRVKIACKIAGVEYRNINIKTLLNTYSTK